MTVFDRILIDGAWRDAADGQSFEVISPADERVLARVSEAGVRDVEDAVRAASAAFRGSWARLSGWERGRLMNRLADLMERDLPVLARMEALEIGRPIAEPTRVDIPSAIATIRTYAGWADKIEGRQIPGRDHFGRTITSFTLREPLGVVAAILPWNAPTMIACWKLAPALATGCTIVLKPAAEAPLSILHLGSLILEAGFPEGVVNILPGRGSTAGEALVVHPLVDKVTFTGSPRVGARIATLCAPLFRPVSLELGGKGPQIICADADLEAAIPGAALNIFSNQGEICAAGSRVIVQASMHERAVELFCREAESRRLGDPLDENTTMGSLVSRRQMEAVLGYIEAGRSEGAVVRFGGTKLDRPGFFVQPTVFSGVHNTMTIAREEIFGPVVSVISCASEEEALAIANTSDYSLSANVWTRDVSSAHRIAHALRAGTVWINGGGTPDPRTAWGGRGKSGLGKELGWAGIEAYTDEKVVNILY